MISKNRIKHIKALHQKKYRSEFQEFIIEGKKSVQEAIEYKYPYLLELFTTDAALLEIHPNVLLINEREMKQISNLTTPGNLLAICKMWEAESDGSSRILVLDGIQDPGNFGTIIRTADWFGIKDIVCSLNTADCFNPKVVQATMGSIFRVNIMYENLAEFMGKNDLPVYGAFMDGVSIFETYIPEAAIIVMGNEGNGISEEVEAFVGQRIAIPKIGMGESLNVAVATGIILGKICQ